MKKITLIALLLSILISACKKDEIEREDNSELFQAIVENISNNVILKTYKDLSEKGNLLSSALKELELNKTEANLEAARNAWIAARSPWEQSEGFLFGPVDQEGIDPNIDSWPVNVTDLNYVLSSPNPITVDFLERQDETLKGFHTIEFLLWGENGDKTIAQFTKEQFQYLASSAVLLSNDLNKLYDLWKPEGGNYINQAITAGNGSTIYRSQKSVIEEFSNAIAGIADEVGNGKINDPLTQNNFTLEESRFSNNSKNDFADNMRSIQNIYLGKYLQNGNGNGLYKIIETTKPEVHQKIKKEIEDAISKIENIPGTFTEALNNNKAAIQDAQTAVRDLQETLESELIPYISNL
ncbi:MAG TPA: imelysin family protein [Chitinophagales bacterium]|nr:imelysin family protein [Chitinophagales bacterium]